MDTQARAGTGGNRPDCLEAFSTRDIGWTKGKVIDWDQRRSPRLPLGMEVPYADHPSAGWRRSRRPNSLFLLSLLVTTAAESCAAAPAAAGPAAASVACSCPCTSRVTDFALASRWKTPSALPSRLSRAAFVSWVGNPLVDDRRRREQQRPRRRSEQQEQRQGRRRRRENNPRQSSCMLLPSRVLGDVISADASEDTTSVDISSSLKMFPTRQLATKITLSGGNKRCSRRTDRPSGVPRCAVVENQTPGGQNAQSGADSVANTTNQPFEDMKDGEVPSEAHAGERRASKHGRTRAGDKAVTEGLMWRGLGSWEGLEEGLLGALLFAQQGLEGLDILPAASDAFWMTFGQVVVPEFPALSELRLFGLSWSPPSQRTTSSTTGQDGEQKQRQSVATPSQAASTAASTASATSATTRGGRRGLRAAPGGSGDGDSVSEAATRAGTGPGNRRKRRGPLSAWRINRLSVAAVDTQVAEAVSGGEDRVDGGEVGIDGAAAKVERTAGKWRKEGILTALNSRLPLLGRGRGGSGSNGINAAAVESDGGIGGRFVSVIRQPSRGVLSSKGSPLKQRQHQQQDRRRASTSNSGNNGSRRVVPSPNPGSGGGGIDNNDDSNEKKKGNRLSPSAPVPVPKTSRSEGPPSGQSAGKEARLLKKQGLPHEPGGGTAEGSHVVDKLRDKKTAVDIGNRGMGDAQETTDDDASDLGPGSAAVGGGARPVNAAPTHFVPKFAPPPNAWKILSTKDPVGKEKQKQQQQQQQLEQRKSSNQTANRVADGSSSSSSSSPPSPRRGELDDGMYDEVDDVIDKDVDEFHDFGDVHLSVTRIPPPPGMEITINRSSGTPADAETRSAAAAAAKAAVDSDNVLEEWVDGEPVEVHHGRMASRRRRQPTRPGDLSGTSGEMKLVEMACLAGLSSTAGKSAGRIMHEEIGFGHLLRGLREDVRPSLRRRVLQAISTVVDSDPSLAPHLLGLDHPPDDGVLGKGQGGGLKGAASAAAETGARAKKVADGGKKRKSGGGVRHKLQGAVAKRQKRWRRRRRSVLQRPVGGGGVGVSVPSGGVAEALVGDDDLLERITAILGYHVVAGASVVGSGGVAPGGGADGDADKDHVGRVLRTLAGCLPGLRSQPFKSRAPASTTADTSVSPPGVNSNGDVAPSNPPSPSQEQERASSSDVTSSMGSAEAVDSGNTNAYASKLADSAETRGNEAQEMKEREREQIAKEGRDWWKDEVALEEEGLERRVAAGGTARRDRVGGGSGWVWWLGRGRRVSRERLVEEALELTFRLIMSGDAALNALKVDEDLVAALKRVAEGGGQRLQYDSKGILRRVGPQLSHSQHLAYKCLACLGAHEWRPKMVGQKGVRILCFDGGGTRGVLTLALLKHVEKALGGRQPHEVFDMIIGTSTGGIIAGLAGVKRFPVSECEKMYDNLINKIFIKHPGGGMKLALKQAFYDEVGWMKILESILGDQLMVESARDPLRPMIVCPSTIISSNPARVMLWRNYNYPPGHQSRYYGSFRYMVRQAIRATTAAPTFFSPLMINGALYSDGALLCNNPSAVAFHEAKHLFPGIPVEMIVSLGTGCFFEEKKEFLEPAGLGWDGIINQVIASATETEITTDIVSDLLPPEQFFRFNPRMQDMPIDEVRKERLDWLKTLADEYFEAPENQARLQEMAERLLPDS